MGDSVVDKLSLQLSANAEEFIASFRAAAEATGKAKNDISLNLRAIKLAAADLNAELASGQLSHSDEISARRNILTLAKQSLQLAKDEGIERRGNLGFVKAFTGEIEKQNAALEGQKGKLSTITAQILNAIKLRAAGLPGLSGLGGALAIRAYEPIGKLAEEGAGKLEGEFGSAAVAIGGTAAALAGLALVAGEVTHHMMDLAQSIENTAAATGLSTTQVQEFNELAREMGIDAGSLEMAFARMQAQLGEFAVSSGKAAGSGSQYLVKTLKEMGVALQDADGSMRPTEQILSDFYDQLQKIPDASTRTAIEMAALGSRGRVLAEVFEQARREGISLQDALKSIDASGAVLTPSELEDLEKAKEDWDKISRAIEGAKTQLGLFIGESLTSLKGFAEGAAAIGENILFGENPLEFRKKLDAFLNPEKAKAGVNVNPFINPAELLQITQGNTELSKRLDVLRAGGELQLQLNQAEASYNGALKQQASLITALKPAEAAEMTPAIEAYFTEISLLKDIIALQKQKADLSKLQEQLDEAQQAYTVAAVEGNKSLTAEKAKQIALYDREITSLQKSLGLTKELASLASVKPEFSPLRRPAPGPAPSAEEIALQNKYGEGLDINPSPSQQDLANYYGQRKYEKQFAGQEIPGISMAEAAPPMEDLTPLIGESTHRMLAESAEALDELRQKWVELAATADSPAIRKAALGENISMIQEQYQKDLQNFQLMFEMKKITAEQFAQAEAELEQMANQQIKAAWDERVAQFGTVAERMRALEQQIADESKNFSAKVFDEMARMVDGVEDSLARLVVTGKGSFRQLFEGIAEEMTKNTISLGFSKIAGEIAAHSKTQPPKAGQAGEVTQPGGIAATLGKIFGAGKNGATEKLGTKTNPAYVIEVSGTRGLGVPAALTGAGTSGLPGAGWMDPFKKTAAALTASGGGGSSSPDWMKALGIGSPFSIPKPPSEASSGAASASPDWMKALGIGASIAVPKPPVEETPGAPGGGVGGFFKSILGSGMLGGILGAKGAGQSGDSDSGGLGSFASIFGGAAGEGSGGGMMSLLNMTSLFAGFLEEGGDVTPGRAYVVGEKHPEIFFPGQSGRVEPFMKMPPTSGRHTTVNLNINGVENADSFRRSSSQIASHLHAQVSGAAAKNK